MTLSDLTGLRARLAEAERLLYSDTAAADAMAAALVDSCADADRDQAVVRVKAETVRLIVALEGGRAMQAIDRGLRLVHQATVLEDRTAEARLWNVIGAAYDTIDLPERAVRCYDRALQHLDPGADAELCRRLETNLGVAFSRMEEDEQALVHFARAAELGRRVGAGGKQARLLHNQAISHRKLDRLAAARAAVDRAEALAREAGHDRSLPYIHVEQARILAREGRIADALALLDPAIAQAEAGEQLDVAASAWLLRSELLRTAAPPLQDAEAAIRAARTGLALARRIDTPEWRRKLNQELSEALAAAGQHAEALDALRRSAALAERQQRRQRDQELATLRIEHDVDALQREQAALRAERAALAAANARLRQHARERAELAAIATHDLRNPLHLVCLLAEELAEGVPGRRSPEEIGAMLRKAGNRMVETVDQILASHAAREAPAELPPGPVRAAAVAARVTDALRPVAEAKDIDLRLVVEAPEALVHGRRGDLEQVVDNLVGNAVKYTPPGGGIEVRLRQEDDTLVLDVCDEGPGLTDQDLSQVFGKWARLSARPTGGESSSGLGLWITRERVGALGGRIEAGRCRDGGARFTVVLPLLPSDALPGALA